MSVGAEPRLQFFVVGAQKCGTTALDHFLRQNRSLQMPKKKELHFFDDEGVDWSAPDYGRLHGAFDPPRRDRIRGEVTPAYIFWPPSLARIKVYNPEAKIIVGLRHPTFRAFSQWQMATNSGNETLPFAIAVGPEGRKRTTGARGRHFSYVERGLYADQIRRALGLFPREQVLFYRTDDLWRDPRSVVGAIESLLGVPHANAARQQYVVPLEKRDLGSLDGATRASLDALFAPDIAETAALTGLDLSDWLSPEYKEPMAAPTGNWLSRWLRRKP
jgi:hypothetical protein